MPTGPTPTASPLQRVCVFCGSSPGRDPAYLRAAADLGRTLAGRGATLVFDLLARLEAHVPRVEPKWIDP